MREWRWWELVGVDDEEDDEGGRVGVDSLAVSAAFSTPLTDKAQSRDPAVLQS